MNNGKINNFHKGQVAAGLFFVISSAVLLFMIYGRIFLFWPEIINGLVIGFVFYFFNITIWCVFVSFLLKPKKEEFCLLGIKKRQAGHIAYGVMVGLIKLMIIVGFFWLLSAVSDIARIAAIFSFIILLLLGSILTIVFESKSK